MCALYSINLRSNLKGFKSIATYLRFVNTSKHSNTFSMNTYVFESDR